MVRAVVNNRYGGPEVLELVDLPRPAPGPGQVLIRVVATSINLSDWEGLVGSPLYARLAGLRRPRRPVLGSDIAGVVEAVGPGVSAFSVGDPVYGDNLGLKGGFGEFAVAPEEALAVKPPGLSFAEASTLPQAGAIATKGTVGVGPGTRMLINGAGGGSGLFAIQLAKAAGAIVTGVDNDTKLDLMTVCGADDVIDYRVTDFATTGRTWDRILDLVATRSARACARALAPGGRYEMVGGAVSTLLRVSIGGLAARPFTDRRLALLTVPGGPAQFEPLAQRCLRGEIDIHIERTFTLEEVPQALAHVGQGRSRGKVVVVVDPER